MLLNAHKYKICWIPPCDKKKLRKLFDKLSTKGLIKEDTSIKCIDVKKGYKEFIN
jgi:hypothetical protein